MSSLFKSSVPSSQLNIWKLRAKPSLKLNKTNLFCSQVYTASECVCLHLLSPDQNDWGMHCKPDSVCLVFPILK